MTQPTTQAVPDVADLVMHSGSQHSHVASIAANFTLQHASLSTQAAPATKVMVQPAQAVNVLQPVHLPSHASDSEANSRISLVATNDVRVLSKFW